MATTDIDNLDALDGVDNINAADETKIKAGLRMMLHHTNDARFCIDLFIGQMAAEGWQNANSGDLRALVESPNCRVTFTQTGANKTRLDGYVKVGDDWIKVNTMVMDDQLSATGA